MRKSWLLILLFCSLTGMPAAQTRARQQGTVIRMRMTDCIGAQHGIMAALSGTGRMPTGELCPEYVLVSDTVVYVILGKGSDQLIPLAETTRFHFQKNEMLIRIDDSSKEARFQVKAMMLRPQWDRQQIEQEETAEHVRRLDPVEMGSRQ
jgi:hypothetical protein